MKLLQLMLLLVVLVPVVASETISENQLINAPATSTVYELAPQPYQLMSGYFKNMASKEIVMSVLNSVTTGR